MSSSPSANSDTPPFQLLEPHVSRSITTDLIISRPRSHLSSSEHGRHSDEWELPSEGCFQQACRKKNGVLIQLERTSSAHGALFALKDEYARQKLSDKVKHLTPIVDNLDQFNVAITSMCEFYCLGSLFGSM